MEKYSDVYSLMESNEQARKYFELLPSYVQEEIENRADSINSYESMCHYAENLTQGDR